MNRRIVITRREAVGIGLPGDAEVQMNSADKVQRFPLLNLDRLDDLQRLFADEILKVASIVYDFCMGLAKDHVVSDVTFKKARELFSDQQIVDLIMVTGAYITLAMLSNTAEDATPGGNAAPLQPLPTQ